MSNEKTYGAVWRIFVMMRKLQLKPFYVAIYESIQYERKWGKR